MLWLLTALAAAQEAPPASYHPDKIAAKSEVFARFSRELAPKFDALQADLGRWSQPVEALETAALLAGDRGGEDLARYAEQTRRSLVQQYLRAQAHVSLVEEDSAETFSAAMERALAPFAEQYTLQECGETLSIVALAGPGGRQRARCEGEDLNGEIAAALDADEELAAEVDEMLSIGWPEVALEPSEQPVIPLTGSGDYVQLSELARALDQPVLDTIERSLEDKLAPLEDRIAEGDQEALAEAQAIRERYELAMAERGGQILDAVEKVLAKEGIAVAICANPEALGGCPGADRSAAIIPGLIGNHKIERALR